MPKGKRSSGGGRYVSGGYLTSTGRLYASKPGPKSSSNSSYLSSSNKSYSNKGGGQYIGSGYLTSTGRIYKSKPGPKSNYPTENDSYSFTNGYITSTGRLYKSKPGPKSKIDYNYSRSLTNVFDNLSINSFNHNSDYYDNYYNNNVYNFQPQDHLRIRPRQNQINNFYKSTLPY